MIAPENAHSNRCSFPLTVLEHKIGHPHSSMGWNLLQT
jgi:hypothetical protein